MNRCGRHWDCHQTGPSRRATAQRWYAGVKRQDSWGQCKKSLEPLSSETEPGLSCRAFCCDSNGQSSRQDQAIIASGSAQGTTSTVGIVYLFDLLHRSERYTISPEKLSGKYSDCPNNSYDVYTWSYNIIHSISVCMSLYVIPYSSWKYPCSTVSPHGNCIIWSHTFGQSVTKRAKIGRICYNM